MPGIVAVVDTKEVSPGTIDKMVQPLIYQPRYKKDRLEWGNCSFARVHLGIFNTEPQPVFDESGDLCIFFDGRIYGKGEVAERLGLKGEANDLSDLSFCLRLYKALGEDFVKELNGNFVLCIHDQRKGRTLIATDRFGFRVHYYAMCGKVLLFAPEPKSILRYPAFKKELDKEGVAEFFSLGEFWGGRTLFEGVKMLPPGSILTYQDGEMALRTYWRLEYDSDRETKEDEFVESLLRAFNHATAIRMEDGLRHGVTLSGGLDSRSIIASIPTPLRSGITAFTFGKPESQEVRVASRVAKVAGLRGHTILDSSPELIMRSAAFDAWLNDGRLYIGLAFVYPVFERIRQEVDVIFDGFAMDLTLGGSYLTKEKVSCKSKEEIRAILSKRRRFDDGQLRQLLKPEFYKLVKEVPSQSFKRLFEATISKEPGNISDEFAMNGHVAWMHIGDVAVRSQVEVSHPSSDNDFIDLLLRIPPERRLNHRIYRKFLKRLSPELARIPYNYTMVRADAPLFLWRWGVKWNSVKEFVKRHVQIYSGNRIVPKSKRSYVAYNEWFRTRKDWQDYFEGLLFGPNPMADQYLDREYVRSIFEEQKRGERDHSTNLLYIATFMLFLKAHFGEDEC